MKFFRLLIIIFFTLTLLMGNFVVRAEEATAPATNADDAAIAELNRQIEEQRAKIDKLAEDIAAYQDNVKQAKNEAVTLKNQIYILDNQIAKTKLDIQSKEEEVKATELEVEKINLEIKKNEVAIAENKSQLGAFLRLLDRYDRRSYLTIILGNSTFSDFFDQIKYAESIQKDLQKTLNRIQELAAQLNRQKKILDDKKQELTDLLDKLESKKLTLGGQKDDKQYLVTETKKSEKKFQTLIADLQKEQAAANDQATALERQLRQKLQKGGSQEQFNSLGDAILSWPTDSRRLTCYFHDPDYPYRNLFEHSGIDIGIGIGTPVRAAEAGYVARVSMGTKWYGNYIMIIHNNNLATLYAHLSRVVIANDQYVAKGQLIGYSGNTGFSTGPHLHFEVRYNGIPVDPMGYLP